MGILFCPKSMQRRGVLWWYDALSPQKSCSMLLRFLFYFLNNFLIPHKKKEKKGSIANILFVNWFESSGQTLLNSIAPAMVPKGQHNWFYSTPYLYTSKCEIQCLKVASGTQFLLLKFSSDTCFHLSQYFHCSFFLTAYQEVIIFLFLDASIIHFMTAL
jgi:hypothetical protein